MNIKKLTSIAATTSLVLFLTACGGNKKAEETTATNETALAGSISIDGSSTVYPITEAVAEEFKKTAPAVKVTVGLSGTGGGFKKFGRGETDINDASRPIKKGEDSTCKANNESSIELKID